MKHRKIPEESDARKAVILRPQIEYVYKHKRTVVSNFVWQAYLQTIKEHQMAGISEKGRDKGMKQTRKDSYRATH